MQQNKLVFGQILPYWAGFFRYQCFSVCLTVFLSPLPEVQWQNFFLIFKILGQKKRKEVVSYLRTFAHKGCSLRLNVFLPPLSKVLCRNFLKFRNPWGKIMTRGGLRFESFANKECKIAAQEEEKNWEFCHTSRVFWYWCYYPHRSRDALSPVCRIFCLNFNFYNDKGCRVVLNSNI